MTKTPPPSGSANRIKEYLEIIALGQNNSGIARWWDIYKRAMNSSHTDHVLNYLKDRSLIEGNKESGYVLTEKGTIFLDILKKRADLVGVLTQELSGPRMKRWDT